MNHLAAIALAGAIGAILRFMVSNGVYQYLGRDFPYGTLAVNLIGSFLLGLMTEALLLQRLALTQEFRVAILVGLFGSFTTFSTFSLETVYLLEQGSFAKAGLNISVSIVTCLLAVWLGLWCCRLLFLYGDGVIHWKEIPIPYAWLLINSIGAFLIGLLSIALINKTLPALEYRAALLIIWAGIFMIASSLYLVWYLMEGGHMLNATLQQTLTILIANSSVCLLALWLGLLVGEQV